VAEGFAAIPRNIRWTRAVAEVAHLCVDLGERAVAEELITLLEPAAAQHAVVPIPIAYGGPLRYALARLYELAGRSTRAEETYAAALEDCARVGAEGWRARVLIDAARTLRGAKSARAALEEAHSIATRLSHSAVASAAQAALAKGARPRLS
jgi:hypothetical protein